MQLSYSQLFEFAIVLGKDAGAIFLSYIAAYLGSSYALLGAVHGNTAAWELLRDRLFAGVETSQVKICRSLNQAIVQPTISLQARAELSQLVNLLSQIDGAIRRLSILHRRARFIFLGVVVALIAGLISASPILYGEQAFSFRMQLGIPVIGVLTVIFTVIFYLAFHMRHVEAWSRLQAQAAQLQKRLQGMTLDLIQP